MNKSSLKNFAIEARRELMGNIARKLQILGIDKKGITSGNTMGSQVEINGNIYSKGSYDALVRKYNELGYDELLEESAYTWFNRLTALAYMECNGYIDEKIIFSTTSKIEPDIIDEYNDAEFFQNFDKDLQNRIHDFRDNHNLEEMYSILVEGKCEELSNIMPFMFSKGRDYAEILFPTGLLMENSVLVKLRKEMAESKDESGTVPVELIGWLYQYYNQEKRDIIFDSNMSDRKKIEKNDIPSATQIFTPEWIVKYMVENSLGKLAIESLGVSESLKRKWKFYIETEKPENRERLKIDEIKILDPAMGSGHILTYSFDVLFDIYENLGWEKKDAVLSILKNNMFGLEIDERAGQLASFAVMMKGREKFPRLFKVLERLEDEEKFNLKTLTIQESNSISEQTRELMSENSLQSLEKLLENFNDAKEYGSILKLENIDSKTLKEEFLKLKTAYDKIGQISLFNSSMEITGNWNMSEELEKIEKLIDQQEIMTQKYDVLITNPPYMGNGRMSTSLKNYLQKNYPDVKSDLFAVFIKESNVWAKRGGFIGLVTPYVWWFIKSYEELRGYIIKNMTFDSLIQLEYNAFEGACIPVGTFILRNEILEDHEMVGIKLSDFRGSENQPIKTLEAINDEKCQWKYKTNQKDFEKIPGSPIAYWVSDRIKEIFEKSEKLGDRGEAKQGLSTTDNDRFLRIWSEVQFDKIGFNLKRERAIKSNYKWFPMNKGGDYRKWYGNQEYIVNWGNNGFEIKENILRKYSYLKTPDFVAKNQNNYFLSGLTWTKVTSSKFSVRYCFEGEIFSDAGMKFFTNDDKYILGFFNNKITAELLRIISPTLNYEQGNIANLPIIIKEEIVKENIKSIVQSNISISKSEWDSRETSWDFEVSPLISGDSIARAYETYCNIWRENFFQMHRNEEELNRLFIEIYGLQDEMDEKVDFEDITLLKREAKIEIVDTSPSSMSEVEENEKTSEGYLYNRGVILNFNEEEIMKQFLSYAVGCIMGRYSIDKPGLIIANSDDEMVVENSKIIIKGSDGEIRHEIENPRFIPDAYGIVPVVKEDIFENDIVERVVDFVKAVYGEATLEENLNFIAEALGKKNSETSRDVLRKYFIKDFYKDHLQRYKKRPIYWMMNSGKKDAFSALIYLHRYEENSIGRARADYLLPYQETLDNQRAFYERMVNDEATTPKDRKDGEKKLKELDAELHELRNYANEVKHIADQKIKLDLDDGVKVNYEKFGKIFGKI